MVNLVYANWNYLVSDFYRIKGIATVLYPTSYIPSVSRTGRDADKTVLDQMLFNKFKSAMEGNSRDA